MCKHKLTAWYLRWADSDEVKPYNLFLDELFFKKGEFSSLTASLQWYLHYLKHQNTMIGISQSVSSRASISMAVLFKVFFLPPIILVFAIRFTLAAAFSFSRQHRRQVSAAPGALALRILKFLVPKKAFDQIFSQAISDMREECFEALQERQLLTAKWIILRDHLGLALTFASYLGTSLGKRVVELWKIGS